MRTSSAPAIRAAASGSTRRWNRWCIPVQFAQRLFFLNAGCAHEAPGRVDQSYIERMHNLLEGMRPGAKLMLFAFDWHHREDGTVDRDSSSFHVPND